MLRERFTLSSSGSALDPIEPVPRPSDSRRHHELDFQRDPAVLAHLRDALGHGLFSVDREGLVVAWSAGAEHITGYPASEVVGQPCQFLEGPSCKGFSGIVGLLRADRPSTVEIRNQECRVYSKESRILHLLGNATVLVDAEGRPEGAIGSFVDLSEVLQLNAPIVDSSGPDGLAGLVGRSSAMLEVFRRIRLASDSDVTTLISGESGTGKELTARAIHALSERAQGPFLAVNCSAIPETLLESQLFGHVRGAFTGALHDRPGVFEAAAGGTLFLDEIGDLSPLIQVKLLRVLQEREVHRVGAEKPSPIDVRLVAATNRDMRERVAAGAIREDFYYRVRVFEIALPPLRERIGDVPLLARHFLKQVAREHRKQVTGFAQDALEALVRHSWPGNVRELRNAIEHALVVQQGKSIGLLDLPEEVREGVGSGPVRLGERELDPEQQAEKLRIERALAEHDWNRTRTAEALGFSRVTLWKKIRRFGIRIGGESR